MVLRREYLVGRGVRALLRPEHDGFPLGFGLVGNVLLCSDTATLTICRACAPEHRTGVLLVRHDVGDV